MYDSYDLIKIKSYKIYFSTVPRNKKKFAVKIVSEPVKKAINLRQLTELPLLRLMVWFRLVPLDEGRLGIHLTSIFNLEGILDVEPAKPETVLLLKIRKLRIIISIN